MKVRMLDTVKDSHKIMVQTEKGPEIVPSVILFKKGDEVESDDNHIPANRLSKLVGYGFAEEIK